MKKLFAVIFSLCLLSTVSVLSAETFQFKAPEEFKFVVNEGVSFAQLTRIEKMEDRSNFVRENFLIGAYANFQTVDLYSWIDFILQVSAYYPFYNAFNGMEQFTKNKLNYALDMFFAPTFTYDRMEFLPIDLSLGMHYMYQLTDEYHMSYVGLGFLGTFRMPLTRSWTITNSYFFSLDDANLGTNKKIQPFEFSYQYHINLGVCYSKRTPNTYSYIKGKE